MLKMVIVIFFVCNKFLNSKGDVQVKKEEVDEEVSTFKAKVGQIMEFENI